MPKAPSSLPGKKRHNPLADDLVATGVLKNKPSKRKTKAEPEEGERYVDSRASKNILAMSRELLQEDEQQSEEEKGGERGAFDFNPSNFDSREQDEELYGEDETWGDEEEEVEEIEVEAGDLEVFHKFIKPSMEDDPLLTHGWDMKGDGGQEQQQGGGQDLAEMILAKIAEHEAQQQGGWHDDNPADEEHVLPPKVIEVFEKIGMFLSRYRSGPLPKPLKVLPQIPGWEAILQVTQPHNWTHHAVFAVTRIFVAAKPKVVQRFMEMVVLDHVREDISENKRLNVHLFNALKKGLYKPAGFFKGFLRPLVASGVTLVEARVVSGVLTRVSIPVIHSAMALKELCDFAAEMVSSKNESKKRSESSEQAPVDDGKFDAVKKYLDRLPEAEKPVPEQKTDVEPNTKGRRVRFGRVLWHRRRSTRATDNSNPSLSDVDRKERPSGPAIWLTQFPGGEATRVHTPPYKEDTVDGRPRSLFFDVARPNSRHDQTPSETSSTREKVGIRTSRSSPLNVKSRGRRSQQRSSASGASGRGLGGSISPYRVPSPRKAKEDGSPSRSKSGPAKTREKTRSPLATTPKESVKEWWDAPLRTPDTPPSTPTPRTRVTRATTGTAAMFKFDVPEHLPSSPMCPANPKNPKSLGKGVCVYHGRRRSSRFGLAGSDSLLSPKVEREEAAYDDGSNSM
ncbi:snoRNA-binding rRNA-processing protein [Podospora pseudoanserina]|uniref:SnoRNA-binding rRNA-processing protein n=1 Tax=Podospora pseudoanserina TaxID=2609844 RepID=A0ABR0HTA8_9PEZI|nr:snoRNA-binding rRNA-processing protein [Podospora pseudoanserina]